MQELDYAKTGSGICRAGKIKGRFRGKFSLGGGTARFSDTPLADMRGWQACGFKISILLAVYNPNMEWLEELLVSINLQTFTDYEVIIMDDGSSLAAFGEIQKIAARSIDRPKKVSLHRSSRNEGSDKTFEKLTLMAEGDYIAFCDQDDIWEKEKLARLAEAVKKENAVMAYSDMSVIDENGALLYPSQRKMRKWLRFVRGDNVTAGYLTDNCTPGCSMLARADLVKKAVPFSRHAYCDQWVAACVSAYGTVAFVDMPLVRYRRHGGNQTGSLKNIKTRQDYYNMRVLPMCRLVEEMGSRGIHFPQEEEIAAFAKARMDKDIRGIWKYRKFNQKYAYFDLLMIGMPDALVEALLRALHKGQKTGSS